MMAEPSSQGISAFLRISRENGELNHGLAVSLGLADSDMWVLYILHEAKEPLTPKEMSVTWSFSKQTLHSSLFKLEKAGYLLIEMSSGNRKNKWVSLTETGEEFARTFVSPVFEAQQRAFARLAPDERNALVTLLRKHLSFVREELGKVSR
jgi:DNA-binding MarR family transcriptional regulator